MRIRLDKWLDAYPDGISSALYRKVRRAMNDHGDRVVVSVTPGDYGDSLHAALVELDQRRGRGKRGDV